MNPQNFSGFEPGNKTLFVIYNNHETPQNALLSLSQNLCKSCFMNGSLKKDGRSTAEHLH